MSLPQRLGSSRLVAMLRRDLAAVAVCAAFLTAAYVVYFSTQSAWRPGSDGFYSYLYARSLAFDFDVDFSNDYALCGDPLQLGFDRGTGRPDNIFYPGPALFWTPVLLLLRVFGVAGNGCGPPWTTTCLALSPLVGAIATFFCFRFVACFFSKGQSALAVALIVFGGPALLLSSSLPSYSHVYELFFAALLCWRSRRVFEEPSLRGMLGVSLALSGLVLERALHVAYVGVALLPALQGRSARRDSAIVLAGSLFGCLPHALIFQALYGSPFTFPHGPYFLSFANAHPFLSLFDGEEGLFLLWPSVWLAVLGLALRPAPDASRWVWALALTAVIQLAVNSSTLDWAPSRRYLNLAPLFALLCAGALQRMHRWLLQSPARLGALAAAALVTPMLAWSMGVAWGTPRGQVPLGSPLDQRTLYGGGITSFFTLMDKTLGRVAVAPAELWFRARYRLPREAFADAVFARWYVRDFRTLGWIDRRIDLHALLDQRLTEGLAPAGKFVRLRGTEARAVFTTQWPHVTHILLRGPKLSAEELRLSIDGSDWLAGVPEGSAGVVFAVATLKLGSGIHELKLEAKGKPTIESLEFDDRVARTPLVHGKLLAR